MTNSSGTHPPPLPKGSDEIYCSSCGKRINVNAEICPGCGVRQRKGADKTALALIAFFLGGVGGHKFYVGKYGQGVLYLLFCWTGIPALAAFIEFIIYLCTPAEDIARKYTSKGAGAVVAVVVGVVGFVFIGGILAAIAVPNFIAYRNKAFCVQVEAEANNTIAALTYFYADRNDTELPTLDELVDATGLQINEMVTVELSGEPEDITIQAYHNQGTCSKGAKLIISIRDEIVAEWK
jgi:TM2 domain-containing membrane protein YozV